MVAPNNEKTFLANLNRSHFRDPFLAMGSKQYAQAKKSMIEKVESRQKEPPSQNQNHHHLNHQQAQRRSLL